MKASGRMGYCFIGLESRELGCMRDGNRPSLSFFGHWQIWLEGVWQFPEGVLSTYEKGALYKFGGASSNGCTPE